MKTLIVGGTWDKDGGKESGLIKKIIEAYAPTDMDQVVNGGHYDDLQDFLNLTKNFEVVYWFANVPNYLPKLRNVKEINPKCLLVTSKRNNHNEYSFTDLVNHALSLKANLCVEFAEEEYFQVLGLYKMRVFDPLGNVWCSWSRDIVYVFGSIYKRLLDLSRFTRQNTVLKDAFWGVPFEVEPEFLEIIHKNAEVFHSLIRPPKVVDRFLGNASFRCTDGFPSFRGQDCILVSRRNVNKEGITSSDFVPVKLDEQQLVAYGDKKPSVDTPVQVQLYRFFPKINYMLHSHTYIEGAPFTDRAIPCGALDEVPEILKTVIKHWINRDESFCINLRGHGSLVCATDLKYFEQIKYYARLVPEFGI